MNFLTHWDMFSQPVSLKFQAKPHYSTWTGILVSMLLRASVVFYALVLFRARKEHHRDTLTSTVMPYDAMAGPQARLGQTNYEIMLQMTNLLTGEVVKYDDDTKTYLRLLVNDLHEMKPCEYSDTSYLIDNITYPNSTFNEANGLLCIDYQTLSNQSISGNLASPDTLTLSVKPC